MKNFEHDCDKFLEDLSEEIENIDKNSVLDVDYSDGILNITFEKSGQTYVVNRHSASQKIWFSSPISGADYFEFVDHQNKWLSEKGFEIKEKLFNELKTLIN
jgi:iron donor protein CyaY